ncbi:MAG: DEAD/DEAH box helicase, partial [Alphaproteobacteria bacterium]
MLVPYPVERAYDYAVPEGEEVQIGDYVLVPLGGREVTGVVWGAAAGDVDPAKVKTMHARHALPPMAREVREFIDWVADYTCSPRGSVLKMALSAPDGFKPSKPQVGYRVTGDGCRLTVSEKQRAVVDVLSDGVPRIAAEVAREADVGAGVVKTLVGKGILEQVEIVNPAPCLKPDPFRDGFDLSEEQDAVAGRLRELVKAGAYAAALIDGVTGAGKTEVYFEGVAQVLKKGRQVLILLPEIALSNAFTERFVSRFGCVPALWHSGLSKGARKNTWRGVAKGDVKVVIGARSALFLPYRDLGFIVVDEEHDPAYKQEDGVIYHARDM